MSPAGPKRRLFALAGFGLALALAAFCYRPALTGDFRLDDRANLGGLAAVADGAPVLDFVLAGDAGPTGRPLALATFALQADSWAAGPAGILVVNILVHLGNAILLAFCCYRLGRAAHSEWRSRAYALRYVITFSVMASAVPLIAWLHGKTGFHGLFLLLAAAAALIFCAVLLLPGESAPDPRSEARAA